MSRSAPFALPDPFALADWRRRVAELYARIRAEGPGPAAWRHWRDGRDSLFATHPQSPLSAAQIDRFTGVPLFPYDPALCFTVAVQPCDPEQPWPRMDLGPDGTATLQPAGRTQGLESALGGELTVYWISGYGGGLFLPFADASNGKTTYGAGRYLLDGIKGADLGTTSDGALICDFNFAYNPSCAYSDTWVCPLPPRENTLPAAIHAGERTPAL